jgi:hypothetical protein
VLAFNNFFVRSTSTFAAVVVPAPKDQIVVTMNGILDDALSLTLSRYSLALLEDGDDESEDEL